MVKLLEKYKKLPVEIKAIIWFTFCNIIQKGISTISVPIFTRLLSTEEYGRYVVYNSWQTILLIFTSLNVFYGVFNNAMMKYKNERIKFVSAMQGLTITITTLLLGIYFIFNKMVCSIFEMSNSMVLLMFCQLMFVPAFLLWASRMRFEYEYRAVVVVSIAKTIANPLLGIVFVLNAEDRAFARISSIVLTEMLVGCTIMIYQFIKGRCFFCKKYWIYALGFNLPLIPHYLSGEVLNQSDRIMIEKMAGSTEAAIYSVAYAVGMLMLLVTDSLCKAITPWFYKKMEEKKYAEIDKITQALFIFVFGIALLMLFLAPELIRLFAPKEYVEAVYIVPPVTASTFLIFIYNLFANIEFYFEEKRAIMLASVFAAIMNIVLNSIFIPQYGYIAAGYTTLVCYILYAYSHMFFCKIILKKQRIEKIYNIKMIMIITLLFVIISVLMNFLYRGIITRYILLLIVIAIILVLRKRIISVIGMLRK